MANDVKRMRFFDGLFLKQEEFNLEQDYHIRMGRLHNRHLHKWGIAWGLEVEHGPGNKEVTVKEGMALNKVLEAGEEVSQEIILTKDEEVDLSPYNLNDGVYLYISYSKEEADVVEEKGGEEEIHWWEKAVIEHSKTKPANENEKIILAKVVIKADGTIDANSIKYDEGGKSLRTYAGFSGREIETQKLTLSIEGITANLASIKGKVIDSQNGIEVNSPRTNFTGNLAVQGNLTVQGETTVVNTERMRGNVVIGDEDGDTVTVEGSILTGHSSGRLKINAPIDITGSLSVTSGSEILFQDNGQIRSLDNNHRILFRHSENKLEFREYGDIIFSPGATAGAETAKAVMSNNGNVGIGTTNPRKRFDVVGPIDDWQAVFGNAGIWSGTGGGWNRAVLGAFSDTFDLTLNTNGVDRLVVKDNTGNVGVGTSTPLSRLHSVASGGFGGENADGVSLGNNVPILAQSDSTVLGFLNKDSRQAFAINIEGNAGTKIARGYPVFYDKYDGNWHSSIYLRNGNVGIGTATPSEKLEVNGNMKLTGRIIQDDWTSPTLQSEWVVYDSTYNQPGYYMDKNGVVHLRGLVKNGIISSAIFTLPLGYRPDYRELHAVQTYNNTIGRCDILPTGRVIAQSGSNLWFSLDGITFRGKKVAIIPTPIPIPEPTLIPFPIPIPP